MAVQSRNCSLQMVDADMFLSCRPFKTVARQNARIRNDLPQFVPASNSITGEKAEEHNSGHLTCMDHFALSWKMTNL